MGFPMTVAILSDLKGDLRAQADRLFVSLGLGFNAYTERLSRRAEVERLAAMSDGELAELGVRRDRIVEYVFRDKLGY